MKSTKRTSVLIITDWYKPGYKAGGPIQSVSRMADHLKDDLHLSIISRDRDLLESRSYSDIESDKWIEKDAFRIMYCSKRNEGALIRKAVFETECDYIYLNSFFSLTYALLPLYHAWKYGKLNKVILAPRGMLGAGALQIKPQKKRLFIWLFRLLGIHKHIRFHSTDASESSDIRKVFGDLVQIEEVVNFPVAVSDEVLLPKSAEGRFIFASRVSPKKNLLFILEQIKELDIKLNVFGQSDDEAYYQSCLNYATSQVSFNGPLKPKDLFQELREHDFFVLPTLNENFGHAIIEALAHGCPVIISDQTPWNDIEEQGAGWVIPLSHPEKWDETLRQAKSMTKAEYEKMSLSAKEYVRNKFDFSEIRKSYLSMFHG